MRLTEQGGRCEPESPARPLTLASRFQGAGETETSVAMKTVAATVLLVIITAECAHMYTDTDWNPAICFCQASFQAGSWSFPFSRKLLSVDNYNVLTEDIKMFIL